MPVSFFDNTLDVEWYAATYGKQIQAGSTPQKHWIMEGRDKGLFPNRIMRDLSTTLDKFDADWYLSEYRDVRSSGVNPLYHYLTYGMKEGRKRNRSELRVEVFSDPAFDADWYLRRYPDVASSSYDPIEHYIIHGRAEGRAPNASAAAHLSATHYVPLIGLMFLRMLGRDATEEEKELWKERLLDGYGSINFVNYLALSPEGINYFNNCRRTTERFRI